MTGATITKNGVNFDFIGGWYEYIFECYPSGPVERKILHNTRLDGTDRYFDFETRRELRQV